MLKSKVKAVVVVWGKRVCFCMWVFCVMYVHCFKVVSFVIADIQVAMEKGGKGFSASMYLHHCLFSIITLSFLYFPSIYYYTYHGLF